MSVFDHPVSTARQMAMAATGGMWKWPCPIVGGMKTRMPEHTWIRMCAHYQEMDHRACRSCGRRDNDDRLANLTIMEGGDDTYSV